MRRMLRALLAALLMLVLVFTGTAAGGGAGRGTLVSATPLYVLAGPDAVVAELAAAGFGTDTVRHGVEAYQLVYRTVDAHGRPTTASGLVAVPHDRRGALRVVSYAHGSELQRAAAPSTSPHGFNAAPAVTFAAAGFAAVAPDYVGLGAGPGDHPWLNVPSAAAASLDLLRAARQFLPTMGRFALPSVLSTGFSQGGAVAVGLGKVLRDGGFSLGAAAPIAGAYAVRDAQLPAMLAGAVDPKLSVLNAAYALVAFDRVFDVYADPADVFTAAYADTVEGLVDGSHSWPELAAGTPNTLPELLTPTGIALLSSPTGTMVDALAAADGSCRWAPRAPVRLYVAAGDEQVVGGNSTHCQADLAARGVTVPIVDLGAHDHLGSRHFGANVAGTAAVTRWFAAL